MQIVIEIPKEFESHFLTDKFEDSLHRLSADAHLLAGNYEKEMAEMLVEAFQKSIILPKGHRGIVTLKAVKWTFDDAILSEASRTGRARATSDEIYQVLKEIPKIVEEDEET